MGLSIITPHLNEVDGLKRIFSLLMKQTNNKWEWIVVDDFSDAKVLEKLKQWTDQLNDNRVKFIINDQKTNASVCRNKGLELASYENLIFLDADDYIDEDFVANRDIKFDDFAIFPNYNVVGNKVSTVKRLKKERQDLLNSYLSAKFLWQTTCVLWDKAFLKKIGKFDPNLERLQDVELFIRALSTSQNYTIVNNKVDFYYNASTIGSKADIVKKSCNSVNYLISKLALEKVLDQKQKLYIKGYFYACVKGLQRSKNRKDTIYVKETLNLFRKKDYIGSWQFYVGRSMLFLYKNHGISDSLFLSVNRYIFK